MAFGRDLLRMDYCSFAVFYFLNIYGGTKKWAISSLGRKGYALFVCQRIIKTKRSGIYVYNI